MAIAYDRTVPSAEQYRGLMRACTLGARRPLDEAAQLIAGANLFASAWEGGDLVGVARCWTDTIHTTYVADLAVRETHQKHGIGKRLLREVQAACPRAMIVLIAAPLAHEYYGRIGMAQHRSCWVLRSEMKLL